MKGLLVRRPWIDLILAGEKTWELRSRRTHHRGPIALIASGSGLVVGVAEIVGCEGPFDAAALARSRARHHASPQQLREIGYTHAFAWVLEHARRLPEPLPYRHPIPATIWVTLAPRNCPRYAELSSVTTHVTKNATANAPANATLVVPPRGPAAKASPPAPTPAGRDDRFCRSFGIRLDDGVIVYPFRVHDRLSGQVGFKLSRRGNTNDDAELIDDETQLRSLLAAGSYRIRASRLDGTRAGLVIADASRLVPRK